MSAKVFAGQVGAGGQAAGGPAVLSLSIKEKAALYAAFMPFVRNGGVFAPTNRQYHPGDDGYPILTLLDDPTQNPVAGTAVSGSPSPRGGPQAPQTGCPLHADRV